MIILIVDFVFSSSYLAKGNVFKFFILSNRQLKFKAIRQTMM